MKIIIASLLFMTSISVANAGFIGNTLDADYLYSDIETVMDDMTNKEVGLGAEWTSFDLSIDANDSSIVIKKTGAYSSFGSDGTFNGWSFTDTLGAIDDIIAVTIDTSTLVGFDSSGISFTQDSIFLNFIGIDNGTDFYFKVNVDFDSSDSSVPEPSIIALFGLGLAGLGFARRRS